MPHATVPVFALPERLAAKAAPALIAADEERFAAIGETLAASIAVLSDRLDEERRMPGGTGQEAMDRDIEIHRLTSRLRTLRRYGLDLCLGRFVPTGDAEPVYIGRLGLSDADGRQLLVDWRTPAAEPFFAATHARPMGLDSRRRYRWTGGRITDYWDEVFTEAGLSDDSIEHAALDDQSAFIASLGASRSPRMRDVLGTIQADQDAIIRAGSRGALVVDGGPGTGKTVVALHRAAYLIYADPLLSPGRGGVLFVGPSAAYLSYVEDVLPSLGEDGVQTCTLRDLVLEGASARPEPDSRVAALKASGRWAEAVEAAVRHHERPPQGGLVVETEWADVMLDAEDWAEAFASAEPGLSHNDARDQVWESLVEIALDRLTDRLGDEVPPELLHRAVAGGEGLRRRFARAWPVLDSRGVIADLWSVPAYLSLCAPWLDAAEVALLQRPEARAWTVSDLPLLDAAQERIGDPEASALRRRREAEQAAQRAYMDDVVDHMIAADDSEMLVMSMLRGDDLRSTLVDEAELSHADPDALAGPFAHVIVDEAQELTDAEWGMLLRRCPSRSMTIVGDRAQARHGFAPSWAQRLERAGLHDVRVATLTINYRTPEEVMAEAEPVILAAVPDANVPVSVRRSGIPVTRGAASELPGILDAWLAAHAEGVACVIGDPSFPGSDRVRSLSPELAKGLEFDLVVLVDPDRFGTGVEGAVDRYVAMTRATQRLVILGG